MKFITVCEYEDSEPVEIPLEEDDTVLFTTLSGQFPKVTGLKYRYSGLTNFRAVKLCEGKLYKPAEGWDDLKFICVFPKEPDNKRKCKEEYEISTPKTKRLEGKKCTDLIVLNLGWKVDEEMLKKYFSKYGELVLVQVKKDRETSHSKGFAFVRFADYESQVSCLADKHLIDGRWCAVKVPFSKSEADKQEISKKIHVSYNSEEITMDDLRKAFEEYGYVTDIFIPKPFRNFAFITFESSDTAQQLIGRTVCVKGQSISIGSAVPKITGNKKPIPTQFPIFAYNDQTFTARLGWPGYEHAVQPYRRQTRGAPNNVYGNHNHYGNNYTHNYGSHHNGNSNGNNYYYSSTNNNHSSVNTNTNCNTSSNITITSGTVNGTSYPNSTGMISVEYGHQAPDMGHNTAAMAALNILNNPDVVAAIVAAASKTGMTISHQHQTAHGPCNSGLQ